MAVQVVFVTGDPNRMLVEDLDVAAHRAAFAERACPLEFRSWTDPTTDWGAFDLVVIRSPWDYTAHVADFSAWLDSVAGLPTLHNPAGIIRWNLNKAYLLELAAAGVPVVPTIVASDEAAVSAALRDVGADEVIVKPAVSAGSRHTGWFSATDPAAVALARRILAEGVEVLVEPCIASVASIGETSAVVFDGEVSHAFRKGPILERGGGLRGGSYREEVAPTVLTAAQRSVLDAATRAVAEISVASGWLSPGVPLLYGRYDLVELDDGSVALLEAELFEPAFFCGTAEGAAGRFADACLRRAGP